MLVLANPWYVRGLDWSLENSHSGDEANGAANVGLLQVHVNRPPGKKFLEAPRKLPLSALGSYRLFFSVIPKDPDAPVIFDLEALLTRAKAPDPGTTKRTIVDGPVTLPVGTTTAMYHVTVLRELA